MFKSQATRNQEVVGSIPANANVKYLVERERI